MSVSRFGVLPPPRGGLCPSNDDEEELFSAPSVALGGVALEARGAAVAGLVCAACREGDDVVDGWGFGMWGDLGRVGLLAA